MRVRGLAIVALSAAFATADVGSSAEAVPALVVQRGGYLYAYAVDGSTSVRLAKVPGSQAALSPDGSLVAFARKQGGISTMRLDGSGRKVVTRGADGSPAWTSDGKTQRVAQPAT
jgi:hypothetical protein